MAYVDGFVTPVREDRKDEYLAHARAMTPLMIEFGMTRMVECWGDDLMRGQQTDFYRAVAAQEARPSSCRGSYGPTRPRVTPAGRR